ncbi:hypothetical protein [Niveispirillum sp.]|uniref:hypothetical protein n=1 Tax=Niveispirillum sp. TaxID=1917217 RepID=UPI001B62862B|nr:hypothetical protein [Niveispirillum sp.]MBP7338345.1 hypothetical protein [Niveispirillum sp.]
MCVILPFARQRFTPTDLMAWNAILADRRRRGLWQKVERSTSRDRDSILIWLPGAKEPRLRLERDQQGIYRLSVHDDHGWVQFRQGTHIIDCLARVEPDAQASLTTRKAD